MRAFVVKPRDLVVTPRAFVVTPHAFVGRPQPTRDTNASAPRVFATHGSLLPYESALHVDERDD